MGVLIGMLVGAGPVSARALLIAGSAPELPVAELSTDSVVARIAMPAPVTAVATSPSGALGYAAAGNAVVEIDIDTRTEIRRSILPGPPISQLVTARDGRLLALQDTQLTVIDPAGLTVASTIALGANAQQLTAGRRATRAVVVLSGERIAIVALDEARVARTVHVPGAAGAAIDGGGRTWVVAGRVLRLIPAGAGKVSKRARISLPPDVGGRVALAPRDSRIAIGSRPGASGGAIVNLVTRRVRRLASGPGPGAPAWSLDATRVYMADGAGASVSIIGAASGRLLDTIALPGSTPVDVIEQPGLALLPGSDIADTLIGTGGPDRMEGMGGDDYLRSGRGRDIINGGAR